VYIAHALKDVGLLLDTIHEWYRSKFRPIAVTRLIRLTIGIHGKICTDMEIEQAESKR